MVLVYTRFGTRERLRATRKMEFEISVLSDKIRQLMYEYEMTIARFSEHCGLPEETVRSILYGKCRDCKVSTVVKIAGQCGVSLDWLCGMATRN